MPDGRIQRPEKISRDLQVVRGGPRPENLLAEEASTSPEALEELCDLYVPKIYNFALRRVGNIHDAEDITSTVFEKVLANIGNFDSDKASFSTWIYRIAINSITDYFRGRARRREASLDEATYDGGSGAPAGVERLEKYIVLIELLEELPGKYKQAIALRYFGGLRVLEVAEVLGISETAASKRILRGLDELKKMVMGGPLEELL